MSENGLYPIAVKRKSWFLDKGRLHPVLRIARAQLPLAPAFAMTAHASQGQTFKRGCIVDLRIGNGTNPTASYVALTRVQRREDLLIYRPFERELFTKGQRRGPMLLLSFLKGEAIDWAAIEEEFMPRAVCVGCGFTKFKPMYAPQQWTRRNKQRHCKECVARQIKKGTPLQCNTCVMWKCGAAFSVTQQHPSAVNTRVCVDCAEKRFCKACGQAKEEIHFTTAEWKMARKNGTRGKCLDCAAIVHGRWACMQCKEQKPHADFSKWAATHPDIKGSQRKRCDECIALQEQARAREHGRWACMQCKEKKPHADFSKWAATHSDMKRSKRKRCDECSALQEQARARISADNIHHVASNTLTPPSPLTPSRHQSRDAPQHHVNIRNGRECKSVPEHSSAQTI